VKLKTSIFDSNM